MRTATSILVLISMALSNQPLEAGLPDDIATELNEVARLHRNFSQEARNYWSVRRDDLKDILGLDWTASYHSVLLGSFLGNNDITGASGDFTIQGIWAPGKHWREDPNQLRFRLRHRHDYVDRAASEIRSDIGALWGVVKGFSNGGFEIPDFYIRHVYEHPQIEVRYGQMAIDAQFGGHQLASAKKNFLNQAFSSNPVVAFPRFGAGFTAEKRFNNNLSIGLGVTTVQGTQQGDQVDLDFGSGDLFQVLQIGYRFGPNELPQSLQLLGWHSDAVSDAGQPAGEGISITYEQALAPGGTHFFSRLGWANGEASSLDSFFAAGIGCPVRIKDFAGLAFGVGRGSSSDHPVQAVIEGFYRWQPQENLQISPDLQILAGEDLGGRSDIRVIAGVRVGLTF